MNEHSYYDILGVGRDASPDEIERAFRQRARERHPDRNPGDPAATTDMQRIVEAASTLRDPARRQEYDRALWAGRRAAAAASAQPPYGWRAGDVEYSVTLSSAEAARGARYTGQFHAADGRPYAVTIDIPPGVAHGTRLVAPGRGGPAHDGRGRGDFVLVVRVRA